MPAAGDDISAEKPKAAEDGRSQRSVHALHCARRCAQRERSEDYGGHEAADRGADRAARDVMGDLRRLDELSGVHCDHLRHERDRAEGRHARPKGYA